MIVEIKDFVPEHTFDCGQCFRWDKDGIGIAGGKIAKVVRVSRGTLYRFLFRTKNELFIKRQNEIYGQTNENSIYGYTRVCGGTIEKIG